MKVRLGEWNVREQNEPYPHEDYTVDTKTVSLQHPREIYDYISVGGLYKISQSS
jgi:hypothetical protein